MSMLGTKNTTVLYSQARLQVGPSWNVHKLT